MPKYMVSISRYQNFLLGTSNCHFFGSVDIMLRKLYEAVSLCLVLTQNILLSVFDVDDHSVRYSCKVLMVFLSSPSEDFPNAFSIKIWVSIGSCSFLKTRNFYTFSNKIQLPYYHHSKQTEPTVHPLLPLKRNPASCWCDLSTFVKSIRFALFL